MLKDTLHLIASAVLWIVFVIYWRIVLGRPMNPDTRTALAVLSIIISFSVIYLAFWVRHNVRIYRRANRRKARRRVERSFDRDYLGRILVFEERDRLARSNYIEVEVRPGFVAGRPVERKVFRARTRGSVSA